MQIPEKKLARKRPFNIRIYEDALIDVCRLVLKASNQLDLHVYDRSLTLCQGDNLKEKVAEFAKVIPHGNLYLDLRSPLVSILVTAKDVTVNSLLDTEESQRLAEDCTLFLSKAQMNRSEKSAHYWLNVGLLVASILTTSILFNPEYNWFMADWVPWVLSALLWWFMSGANLRGATLNHNQVFFDSREQVDIAYRTRDALFSGTVTAIISGVIGFALGIVSGVMLATVFMPPK